MTEVTYVVVTGTKDLGICWLKEREELNTKPRLHADEQGGIG